MTLLIRLQNELDRQWAELDQQWWAHDRMWADLDLRQRMLARDGAEAEPVRLALRQQMDAVAFQQDEILGRMDDILSEMAQVRIPRPELADPSAVSSPFAY
jgi:hypothetical protein